MAVAVVRLPPNQFTCSECQSLNCISCATVHAPHCGATCDQHHARVALKVLLEFLTEEELSAGAAAARQGKPKNPSHNHHGADSVAVADIPADIPSTLDGIRRAYLVCLDSQLTEECLEMQHAHEFLQLHHVSLYDKHDFASLWVEADTGHQQPACKLFHVIRECEEWKDVISYLNPIMAKMRVDSIQRIQVWHISYRMCDP